MDVKYNAQKTLMWSVHSECICPN